MSKMNLKTMKKTTKSNLITYAMVIVIFAVVQILVATGSMSSLMQGLLVPLCTYSDRCNRIEPLCRLSG